MSGLEPGPLSKSCKFFPLQTGVKFLGGRARYCPIHAWKTRFLLPAQLKRTRAPLTFSWWRRQQTDCGQQGDEWEGMLRGAQPGGCVHRTREGRTPECWSRCNRYQWGSFENCCKPGCGPCSAPPLRPGKFGRLHFPPKAASERVTRRCTALRSSRLS